MSLELGLARSQVLWASAAECGMPSWGVIASEED